MGIDGDNSCTTPWMYLISLNWPLKNEVGKFLLHVFYHKHKQKTLKHHIPSLSWYILPSAEGWDKPASQKCWSLFLELELRLFALSQKYHKESLLYTQQPWVSSPYPEPGRPWGNVAGFTTLHECSWHTVGWLTEWRLFHKTCWEFLSLEA